MLPQGQEEEAESRFKSRLFLKLYLNHYPSQFSYISISLIIFHCF